MRMKFFGRTGLSLIIISLLVLPTFVQAEKQKIRVVVENASIRLHPNMESEVLENPPVGSVFESQKKVGEWYEIRFSSRVGVMITGYIHEMLVELDKGAPQRRKEVAQPPPPPPPPSRGQPPKIMFSIGVGGLVQMVQAGYDWEYAFTYFDEQARITDSTDNGTGFGFDLIVGVFVMPSLEITGGISYFSATLSATYGFDLPNMFVYYDIAHAETQEDAGYTGMMFNFGLNFHPVTEGSVRPYIGGGISYVSAKMDQMQDMTYQETYYADWSHTIEIVEVDWVETDLSKLGFTIKGGVNFEVATNIYIFGEGRYVLAKTTIPHPLAVEAGIEAEEIEIDLGGPSFVLGVKIAL